MDLNIFSSASLTDFLSPEDTVPVIHKIVQYYIFRIILNLCIWML